MAGQGAEPYYRVSMFRLQKLNTWFAMFAAAVGFCAIGLEASEEIFGFEQKHLAGLLPVPIMLMFTSVIFKTRVDSWMFPWLCLANGYLCAVSFVYTLAFAPLVLEGAIVLIMFFGIGLLPHAPLFSLIAAVLQNVQLRQYGNAAGGRTKIWRWWLAGVAVAALFFYGAETRQWAAHRVIARTKSPDPEIRSAAVERLRRWRLEDVVLEACYPETRRRVNVFLPLQTNYSSILNPAESRVLYYVLTGKDYRDVPRPLGFRGLWRSWDVIDSEIGGGAVGSAPPDLVLNSSALDVSVSQSLDGKSAGPVAYAELTLEFHNSGQEPREARCQIVMPPGGAASRLTLWIDNEEQEAAFGPRSVVREAYRKVAVVRRRDPALLTAAGPDRVLLQCFPINPGVPMKVKVGFSLPLIPDGSLMTFQPPYLAERNFAFAPGRRTAIWAEGRTPLRRAPPPSGGAFDLLEETPTLSGGNLYTVSGTAAPQDLASPLLLMSPPESGAVYRARFSGVEAIAELRRESPMRERLIAVVLDTSKQCGEVFRSLDWGAILREMPEGVRAALFAGSLTVPAMGRDEAAEKWPSLLRGVEHVGGDDQTGNLEKAWKLCASERNGAVLWIHGPLPVDIGNLSGLERRMRRAAEEKNDVLPQLLSLQILPGPNRIEEKLSQHGLVRLPTFYGQPAGQHLKSVFSRFLYSTAREWRLIFSLVPGGEESSGGFGSSHVVRLAFAGDVVRKLSEGARELDDETETALALRLVTPLSGAVVLETKAQYTEHDLNPSAYAKNVPTIPEPEEWAVIAVVFLLLLLACRWRVKTR
ncbi:MAG: hypothetical protein LBD04_05135 [Synergistaceae bacterium]|nr:hypothetical protein [Synergistaceae bacterium]